MSRSQHGGRGDLTIASFAGRGCVLGGQAIAPRPAGQQAKLLSHSWEGDSALSHADGRQGGGRVPSGLPLAWLRGRVVRGPGLRGLIVSVPCPRGGGTWGGESSQDQESLAVPGVSS